MRKWRETDLLVNHFAIRLGCVALAVTCCWNMDMCKPESLQSYESRARQADSLKSRSQTAFSSQTGIGSVMLKSSLGSLFMKNS